MGSELHPECAYRILPPAGERGTAYSADADVAAVVQTTLPKLPGMPCAKCGARVTIDTLADWHADASGNWHHNCPEYCGAAVSESQGDGAVWCAAALLIVVALGLVVYALSH